MCVCVYLLSQICMLNILLLQHARDTNPSFFPSSLSLSITLSSSQFLSLHPRTHTHTQTHTHPTYFDIDIGVSYSGGDQGSEPIGDRIVFPHFPTTQLGERNAANRLQTDGVEGGGSGKGNKCFEAADAMPFWRELHCVSTVVFEC